jgi:sugar O-acyltransferase (sialic acid O-acetyltransferase NeuD family)
MPIKRFFLIGAGGHGLVVLDAVRKVEDNLEEVFVLDQSEKRIGKKALDITVQRLDPGMITAGERFHVCIGDNNIRARLLGELAGGVPTTVIHPIATLASSAVIGSGSFVAARAIVAPDAVVGDGVIINHGTIVDHECVVGDFSHLAPNATLAGNVRIGSGVLVGAGANILPGISIGAGAIIGAGAVVTTDVPPGATYVGVPARQIH